MLIGFNYLLSTWKDELKQKVKSIYKMMMMTIATKMLAITMIMKRIWAFRFNGSQTGIHNSLTVCWSYALLVLTLYGTFCYHFKMRELKSLIMPIKRKKKKKKFHSVGSEKNSICHRNLNLHDCSEIDEIQKRYWPSLMQNYNKDLGPISSISILSCESLRAFS